MVVLYYELRAKAIQLESLLVSALKRKDFQLYYLKPINGYLLKRKACQSEGKRLSIASWMENTFKILKQKIFIVFSVYFIFCKDYDLRLSLNFNSTVIDY